MKILLLLANSSIEEYFKSQKGYLDSNLEDNVYFHSLNYNCVDEEVFKCVSNMKPDLIIYRSGIKDNKNTIEFLGKIKSIRPSCNIFILAENMSLIFMESLYDIGIYDFFIGKQIEVIRVIQSIKDYWSEIETKKRNNKNIIESIAKNEQFVSKEKNNYSFVIAENLLPEGIISPGKKKRISLIYYNLNIKNDVFNMKFSIDYFDELGIEKTSSFEAFMDNPKEVIEKLDSFNYVEEEFFEDYRYLYSSYDIIYNDFKVHGNMNWDGLFKDLSEYTKFDKMKKLSINEIPYNVPYSDFIKLVESKDTPVIEEKTDNQKNKKKFSFFKNK